MKLLSWFSRKKQQEKMEEIEDVRRRQLAVELELRKYRAAVLNDERRKSAPT